MRNHTFRGANLQYVASPTTLGNLSDVTIASNTNLDLLQYSSTAGKWTDVAALTTPQIQDTSANHQYVFAVSELAADRTVTLPLLTGNDTFVFAAHAETLTNKTLTSPTINGGALTALTDLDMTVGNKTILDTIGANTLTIGASGTTVTIPGSLTVTGTTTTVSTTNTLIADKLITLNDGGAASSGTGVGIEVEEDSSATGYFKTAADRAGWELKAPSTAGVLSIDPSGNNNTIAFGGSGKTFTISETATIDQNLATTASVTFADLTVSGTSTTIGTVTSGVWEGTTVAVAQGGTGATSLNNLITLSTHTTGNYAATVTGGTGITSTGATSGEGIAHSLSVDASQTQITAVGTIATGTWQGTDVGVAYGGTGVSTLASNSVLTGNGASAITAEANLTFDGSSLDLNNQGGLLNVGASGNDWTATAFTHDGAATFNESGGNYDFRVESENNANMIVVDASADVISFGTAPSNDIQFYIAPNTHTVTTNTDFSRVRMGAQGIVTIPSGTAAHVSTLTIEEPWLTATGTVTNTSSLRIIGPATEGTNNYALWVDSGVSRFDGNINLNDSDLLNVGASGSDWDTTSLRNAADYFGANGKGMVIGHTAKLTIGNPGAAEFQIHGTTNADSSILLGRWSLDDDPPRFAFVKSKGTIGNYTAVANNYRLGEIEWYAADGTNINIIAARISAKIDTTANSVATLRMPTELIFSTATGASDDDLAARMIIKPTGEIDFQGNALGITSVGGSGNDWTQYSLTLAQSRSGTVEMLIENTSTHTSGVAELQIRVPDTGADATVHWKLDGGRNWYCGLDNSTTDDDWAIGTNSLGIADALRIAGSDGETTLTLVHGTVFDYVCDSCGRAEIEMFECCGTVAWHDDVLALREMSLNRDGLEHMAKLGVMKISSNNDGSEWLGINIQTATQYTWSGMYQLHQRMDAQNEAMDERLTRIEQALGV